MSKKARRTPEFTRHRDAFVSLEGLGYVRSQLEQIVSEYVPPLRLGDAVGLITLGLSANLKSTLLRGFPLRMEYRVWCESRAVEIVLRSHPSLCAGAMGLPLLLTPELTVPRAFDWWTRWNGNVLTPIANSENAGDVIVSARARCIYVHAQSIMGRLLASPEVLRDGVRAGGRAARMERGGRSRDVDEDRDESLVAEYWELSTQLRERDDLYFIGMDGRLRINPDYVRDARRSQRLRARPLSAEAEGSLPDRALDVAEVLEATDAVDAVRAVILERQARAASRPAPERIVWQNFKALLSGDITCKSIASAHNLSLRAVQAALHTAREQVAQHPRLRQFARSHAS